MYLNAIKQMEAYARYDTDIVSLSQGIPFLDSDTVIRDQVIRAIQENKVDAYADPQGLRLLRRALSHDLRESDMQYAEDEILVTAGAMEGIATALLACITPEKNEVIIPTPTYAAYFNIVNVAGGRVLTLPLDESRGWRLDMDLFAQKLSKKCAAIVLCNPNNPTGSIYDKKTLLHVCELAKQYNAVLILDEVYKNMLFDEQHFYSPCVEESLKERVIRVVSFSKDFSLTGWRVGFLHTAQKTIEQMLPVHDALINSVPVVSQYAALAALGNKERIIARNSSIYKRHRNIMKTYLDALPNALSYTLPQGSYFFFPKIASASDSQTFCLDLLRKEKVAVVPGIDFGEGGEGHIRLCFGRSEEDIHKGMQRLTNYLTHMV